MGATTSSTISILSYQKLQYDGEIEKEEEEEERAFRNIRKCSRFSKYTFRRKAKIHIPVMRRCWKKRSRLFSKVSFSWIKALKNGKVHMNNLFAANYQFMQANPTTSKRPYTDHPINIHGFSSTSRKL